ncbi:MAG: MBL fold metallo-hydrolase RNA specificity domain-containing protein, partial [Bradymonadaceae bacterium]
RMSYGDHHQLTICDTDTVVLSARQIPGNEYGINQMVNNLIKRGARVITQGEHEIHGSGHAKQEEIKLMMTLTRPQYLVPVHGEYRMRKGHAELSKLVGVPRAMLVEDGDVLEFTAAGANIIGRVQVGRQLVDGRTVGDYEDMQIRDRQKLASAGLIIAFAVMDRDKGELVKVPDLLQRGVVGPSDSDALLERAAQSAFDGVANLPAAARRDINEVQEAIRVHVRRFFRKELDRKPVVIPIVHEL